MLTDTELHLIHAHAGESSRDRDRDYGVSVVLLSRQGGVCFDCGAAAATEFAHFARGAGRAVAVDGRLIALGAMACRRCNLRHLAVTDALGTDGALPLSYFAARGALGRVDVSLPTRIELTRAAREDRDMTEDGFRQEVEAVLAAMA